jgi:hypothetical protein
MKLQEILEELKETVHYKNFISKNPDAFFCAGFFIFDIKNSDEQIQLDFFIPKLKKIASFEFPFAAAKIHDDPIQENSPQDPAIKIDIDDVIAFSKKTIAIHESRLSPTKIIAVLQKGSWNLTCMDEALGIIRIKVDATTEEELSFDKGSLMDFMGIQKGKS